MMMTVSLTRLSRMEIDASVAAELRVGAETLFDGERVMSEAVLEALLAPRNERPVVHTVLGVLSRLLVRQGRDQGDETVTAKTTAQIIMSDVWGEDPTRAAELLLIVLHDGMTSAEERARSKTAGHSDLVILTKLTLGLAAVLGASEGTGAGVIIDDVAEWPSGEQG
jgi:hypothetical protein